MSYIAPEVIELAKKIDLLTYLETFEPEELVCISDNNYTTKTHDSLKISNGKWMWWSRRIGGYSALDYLIKVRGYSFIRAVGTLMGKAVIQPSITVSQSTTPQPKVLLLPEKSDTNNKITAYLFGRGIDYAIIEYCIAHDLIFESLPYHNLVCVGYDKEDVPRYASYRATNHSRLMGDCVGSDKHYSFRITDEESTEVHLFECAIDLLSYATIERMNGKDWKQGNLVSLAGVYMPKKRIENSTIPVAFEQFLSDQPNVRTVYLHFDNDIAGRKATAALQAILPKKYEVVDSSPPCGKDYNDFLCFRLGIERTKPKERTGEAR